MTKKLVVSASLLAKSQVASYTRSDGTVVQAHDNGRQAAAPSRPAAPKPKPSGTPLVAAGNHAAGEGFKVHGGEVVHHDRFGPGKQHGVATSKNADGSHSHYMTGNGGSTWGPMGKTAAGGDAKAAHEKFAGTLKQMHGEPAAAQEPVASTAAKTGSAAPAKMKNVGTDKWPLHAKSSDALGAKHPDGSTHHIGGFEPPAHGKGDHLIHHDGKTFSYSGKSGKNMKTGEASYEYRAGDTGEHRAWVTRSGHLMND